MDKSEVNLELPRIAIFFCSLFVFWSGNAIFTTLNSLDNVAYISDLSSFISFVGGLLYWSLAGIIVLFSVGPIFLMFLLSTFGLLLFLYKNSSRRMIAIFGSLLFFLVIHSLIGGNLLFYNIQVLGLTPPLGSFVVFTLSAITMFLVAEWGFRKAFRKQKD
jgi:hypothetical protein